MESIRSLLSLRFSIAPLKRSSSFTLSSVKRDDMRILSCGFLTVTLYLVRRAKNRTAEDLKHKHRITDPRVKVWKSKIRDKASNFHSHCALHRWTDSVESCSPVFLEDSYRTAQNFVQWLQLKQHNVSDSCHYSHRLYGHSVETRVLQTLVRGTRVTNNCILVLRLITLW